MSKTSEKNRRTRPLPKKEEVEAVALARTEGGKEKGITSALRLQKGRIQLGGKKKVFLPGDTEEGKRIKSNYYANLGKIVLTLILSNKI